MAAVVVAPLVIWAGLALFGLLHDNPFQVAVDQIATTGHWEPQQVLFKEGSYQWFVLGSAVQAEARVVAGDSVRTAHIQMRHVPFLGWSVKSFEVVPQARRMSS